MKRLLLILLSGLILFGLGVSSVCAKGAWVQIKSTDEPNPAGSNSQWKYTCKSKGLFQSGRQTSDA